MFMITGNIINGHQRYLARKIVYLLIEHYTSRRTMRFLLLYIQIHIFLAMTKMLAMLLSGVLSICHMILLCMAEIVLIVMGYLNTEKTPEKSSRHHSSKK